MNIIIFLLLFVSVSGCMTTHDKKTAMHDVARNQTIKNDKAITNSSAESISRPQIIEIIGKKGAGILNMFVKDDWLFVVEYDAKNTPKGVFKILDLTLPEMPIVATIPLSDQPQAMNYQDGYVYIADVLVEGVHVLDVSKPENAVYSRFLPERYARNISVDKNHAYIAAEEDGLKIHNVSFPMVTNIEKYKDCFALDVEVKHPYMYLACSPNFQIVDISDVDNPFLVKKIDFGSDIQKVVLNDDRAYLTVAGGDLHIVDISDPKNAFLIKTVYTAVEPAGAVDFDERFVYVGSGAGLTILDKKTLIAKHLELNRPVWRIQVVGKYIYYLSSHTVFKIKADTINFSDLPEPPDLREPGD